MSIENKYGIEACIDEHVIIYGVKFGIVGSGITRLGGGNQDIYPDRLRALVNHARPYINRGLKSVTESIGLEFGVTSHAGCGGAALQGIEASEVALETEKVCEEDGVSYFGHLNTDPNGKGYMMRGERNHKHTASFANFTIGGGITKKEKDIKTEKEGEFFDISVDWAASALNQGLGEGEIIEILLLQMRISNFISDLGKNSKPYRFSDFGRLAKKDVEVNKSIVTRAIDLIMGKS
jgi:hypothetical protein